MCGHEFPIQENAARGGAFVKSLRRPSEGVAWHFALYAEHLLDRGFTNFAFVGERSGLWWSAERATLFAREIGKCGFVCREYPDGDESDDPARLREWLAALPKRTAIFAAYDIRARQVLDACMEAGLDVPDDIAILSVDNDEILCETATPTHPQYRCQRRRRGSMRPNS